MHDSYAKVPWIEASISDIATAMTNTPASMYTKSMCSIYAKDVVVDRAVSTGLWCGLSAVLYARSPRTRPHADVAPRTPIGVTTPTC